MAIGDDHSLRVGWLHRHLPHSSGLAIDVAVLDIAQDFLLAHLEGHDIFQDLVIFKGGTALRKLFAGAGGRFSTDLDVAVRGMADDRSAVAGLIADLSEVTLGPFAFDPSNSGGRWRIRVESDFGNPVQTIKLDVGPPCWLEPDQRTFVGIATHNRYGFELPSIPCMSLEEILAEKIARLTRTSTARDAYDLHWAATTHPHSGFDRDLVRRLAVMKVWVDNHGLADIWRPAIGPKPFVPDEWLSPRTGRWDSEEIGQLTHPPPNLADLETELCRDYTWLADLTGQEPMFARADAGDRGAMIEAVRSTRRSAIAPDANLF